MNINNTDIVIVNETLVFMKFMIIALVLPLMILIAMTIINKYKDIDPDEPTTQVEEVYEANNAYIDSAEFDLVFDSSSVTFEY